MDSAFKLTLKVLHNFLDVYFSFIIVNLDNLSLELVDLFGVQTIMMIPTNIQIYKVTNQHYMSKQLSH